MTLTATLIAVEPSGELRLDPSMQQVKACSSIHVLAFSSHGDLLLVESEGDFGIDTFEEVHQEAKLICHGQGEDSSEGDDVNMDLGYSSKPENVLKEAVRQRIAKDHRWKKNLMG